MSNEILTRRFLSRFRGRFDFQSANMDDDDESQIVVFLQNDSRQHL